MSDPSKYPNFTAADIERYHSGKMTDKERNAIEKAALEDPFLSDALEGYLLTSTTAADLESLKKRRTHILLQLLSLKFFTAISVSDQVLIKNFPPGFK